MRIAITVDPEIPVPPLYYGGIERIVAMLVDEFIQAGHEVTLFANADSLTAATLKPYPGKSSKSKIDTIKNIHLLSTEIYNGNFDVLHSFSRLAYLTFILPFSVPKIMSYQRRPTPSQINKAQKLAYSNSLMFTGCSEFISQQIKPYAPVKTIYNGFPEDKYQFNDRVEADAPLVFLGRIEPGKGTHLAIEIALKAKKKLIIAGNIPAEYQVYFDEQIHPQIDQQQIKFIGPVTDVQKSALLGNALAFLMPITWDEPFGIVMVEAMACGTPVIALNRGAVPEIITENLTGFICTNTDECARRVLEVNKLNRQQIREQALSKFGASAIAKQYLKLYRQQIDLINK